MRINGEIIKSNRLSKGWSQQHLADACEGNLRTIQRVENTDSASPETVMTLSIALDIEKEKFLKEFEPKLYRVLPKSDLGVLILFISVSFLSAVLGVMLTYWLIK